MNSDKVKAGVEHAPHRSLLKADGYNDEQMRRPFIGVVNSFNEVAPGHMHLQTIARAVKDGVLAAGGTPMVQLRVRRHTGAPDISCIGRHFRLV